MPNKNSNVVLMPGCALPKEHVEPEVSVDTVLNAVADDGLKEIVVIGCTEEDSFYLASNIPSANVLRSLIQVASEHLEAMEGQFIDKCED